MGERAALPSSEKIKAFSFEKENRTINEIHGGSEVRPTGSSDSRERRVVSVVLVRLVFCSVRSSPIK